MEPQRETPGGWKPSYLVRGLPGHPTHPPLTDATIGAYTFATVAATADVLGISDNAATHGWWLALLVAFIFSSATIVTGVIDWLQIERGTPLFRTATAHALANATASAFFILAAILGKDSFDAGDISAVPYILTLLGFLFLTLGGWLGGTIVFVHGMRVLNLLREPTRRATAPVPHPEKEAAEGGDR